MVESSSKRNGHDDPRPLVYAVDDEPMLLELVALVLEPLGYKVKTFRDPASAVRAFESADPKPVLIVTDFAMHKMNGLDLIRDCRKITPRQKIIMLSGTVDADVYRDSPHKPDAFMAKPYAADDLASLVKFVLGQ